MAITKELCQQLAHYVYGGMMLEDYLTDHLPQYERVKIGDITNEENYYKTPTGLAAAFYYNKDTNEGVIVCRLGILAQHLYY